MDWDKKLDEVLNYVYKARVFLDNLIDAEGKDDEEYTNDYILTLLLLIVNECSECDNPDEVMDEFFVRAKKVLDSIQEFKTKGEK